MPLTDLPLSARPREKLLAQGAKALSDAELLAIFLRTGVPGMNAIELAEHLLNINSTLHDLFNASEQEFCAQKGLGSAKYVQLQAVLELSRRYMLEQCKREALFNSPQAVYDYLTIQLRGLQQEVFMVLYLDSQNQLIKDEVLFYGTINAASVYPREVVKAGDIVKVKVMEVDVQRKRIGLSMRLKDEPGQDNRTQRSGAPRGQQRQKPSGQRRSDGNQGANQGNSAMGGAFAAAFAKAKK